MPFFLTLLFSACTHDDVELRDFTDMKMAGDRQIGCLGLFGDFCTKLYSPEASGNIQISSSKEQYLISYGQTTNNFTNQFYSYSLAKLRNRKKLPKDFLNLLEHSFYFEDLNRLLHRPPIDKMTLEQRVDSDSLARVLEITWSNAINETIIRRMSRMYKDIHRFSEDYLPVEWSIERKKQKRRLISEISKSLWVKNYNWEKVEEGFEDIRKNYLEMLDALDVDKSIIMKWKKRLLSVKLVLPGSLEELAEEECSTTDNNAFFYRERQVITVCAGDFNSEDVFVTLAHELGHSIDTDQDLYHFHKNSSLGHSLASLQTSLCKEEQFDCDEWDKFKERFTKEVSQLKSYKQDLLPFQRCLKKNGNTHFPDKQEDFFKIIKRIKNHQISSIAESQFFIKVIAEQLLLPNGKKTKNPFYLNPCAYYLYHSQGEPIDDPLVSLNFYTAEYICGEGDKQQKVAKALNVSSEMTEKILEIVVANEGEFSEKSEMQDSEYSSSPVERFADVLAGYTLANRLNKMESLTDRRGLFLASNSWQCEKPGIEESYPEIAKIIRAYNKNFIAENYASSDIRRKDYLSAPIRQALLCRKDSEIQECHLPWKIQSK